jgi:7-cyano-7-deazaguanine reductase
MPTRPARSLEVVPNPHPDRDYEVSMTRPSSRASARGPASRTSPRPASATCRTSTWWSKSLKLYLWSYRDEGAFHEDVTHRILNDFVAAARPRWAEVVGDFNVRGGIKTEVRAAYGKRPEI